MLSISPATNLVATPISISSIKLDWVDNSNGEAGFSIQRRTVGGSYAQIGTVGPNVTTYTDSTPSYGVAYQYRVLTSSGNVLVDDDFSGAAIDENVWALSTPSKILQAGGQLAIDSSINESSWVLSGINNKTAFDLTGGTVSVKLVIPTDNRPEVYSAPLSLNSTIAPSGDWAIAEFLVYDNTIWADWQTYADYQNQVPETIDSSHAYLRIREDSGTIYWEKSADNSTWVEMWSVASPFDITSMQTWSYVGSSPDTSSTPTTLAIDDYKIEVASTVYSAPSNEVTSQVLTDGFMSIRQKLMDMVSVVDSSAAVYGNEVVLVDSNDRIVTVTPDYSDADVLLTDYPREYSFKVTCYKQSSRVSPVEDMSVAAESSILSFVDDFCSALEDDPTLGSVITSSKNVHVLFGEVTESFGKFVYAEIRFTGEKTVVV